MLSTDTWLKIVCSMLINAILFGVGIVAVLMIPAFSDNLKVWIPVVVLLSFAIAPLLAGVVARRMRLRNWGKKQWQAGDVISG
ncbi:hypothetical protein [Rhizobium sp. 18065]|uniref:hypothetical protein n=1 Tax=Rhizobium sp. 18065 TaxID=2681411 RepID=UPI001357BC4F|nr:hypothetical protein [Rhizobium sp. 18065]